MNAQFRIGVAVAVLVWSGMSTSALAETRYGPGVSDTEIRIGNTMPYSGPASKLLDMLMLVYAGGRERTETEYRELLGSAGFELREVIAMTSGLSILEAAPG